MINEKKRRQPAAGRPRQSHGKRPAQRATSAPEVVYTPPAPLNRKKLLLRLGTVAAVALALFLGCTVFFRVRDVVVTGTQRYTAWTVREASGIEEGTGLLTFGKAKAAGRVMEELRYIKSVRVGITLPDTVNIWIEELEVTYGVQDDQDTWWLIASDGRVVEQTTESKAREATLLKGFRLENPMVGEPAKAQEQEPADGEVVLVTEQERLEAALSVLTQLERCEVLGDAASVDVTDPANIHLWYGDTYQVLLGDPDRMDEKIMMMTKVIARHEQEGGYQSGVLDITLTDNPNSVGYTPFG